jgi:hypothetical protein
MGANVCSTLQLRFCAAAQINRVVGPSSAAQLLPTGLGVLHFPAYTILAFGCGVSSCYIRQLSSWTLQLGPVPVHVDV